MHRPEEALCLCGFGEAGGGERVRVDLGQREVSEDEAQRRVLGLQPVDVEKGLARVGALVVAVPRITTPSPPRQWSRADQTASRTFAFIVNRRAGGARSPTLLASTMATETQAAPFSGRTAWARNVQTPLREFLRTETGGAAVLLAAARGGARVGERRRVVVRRRSGRRRSRSTSAAQASRSICATG